MKRGLILVLALGVLLAGGRARAEIQVGVPEEFPSKHELTAHLGFQAGFGALVGSVSGFKLEAEYAYRFHPIAWFDVQLGNIFGTGAADGVCQHSLGNCYYGGWAVEIAAGVKLKFKTRIPLVVETPILLGLEGIYKRECGDNGAAFPVLRTGAGVKYFLTPHIGIGGGFNFSFGAGYHASSVCRMGTYADFYGAFDFLIGAEFLL